MVDILPQSLTIQGEVTQPAKTEIILTCYRGGEAKTVKTFIESGSTLVLFRIITQPTNDFFGIREALAASDPANTIDTQTTTGDMTRLYEALNSLLVE